MNSRALLVLVIVQLTGCVSGAQLRREAAQQFEFIVTSSVPASALQKRRVELIARQVIEAAGSTAEPYEWEVAVIDDARINAVCLPGGKIIVFSGLLEELRPTDDELAAVIGHEVAHALKEHSAARYVAAQAQAALLQAGRLAMSMLTNDLRLTITVAQVANSLAELVFQMPFGRSQELEADELGVVLSERAGYRPEAALSLWRKMGALQSSGPPEFLSTHPDAATRIERLNARLGSR